MATNKTRAVASKNLRKAKRREKTAGRKVDQAARELLKLLETEQ